MRIYIVNGKELYVTDFLYEFFIAVSGSIEQDLIMNPYLKLNICILEQLMRLLIEGELHIGEYKFALVKGA